MTDRAGTLLGGRRERLERILGRTLPAQADGSAEDGASDRLSYLLGEAEDLYWNELEWENITDEEALDGGPLTELAFPGLLALVRGLLLREVMPDAKAPASPRPEVVEAILSFLAGRVVELEDERDGDEQRTAAELAMTSRLIDLVLYELHELDDDEVERVEADAQAAS